MTSRPWIGVTLIKVAVVYLSVSLVLGIVMAVREDHSLVSVHSHLGLLGWATPAITGVVYLALPACANSRLAVVHFWLHNVGLPVMLGSLALLAGFGQAGAAPVVGVGSLLVLAGLLAFAVNVFVNARHGDVRHRVLVAPGLAGAGSDCPPSFRS